MRHDFDSATNPLKIAIRLSILLSEQVCTHIAVLGDNLRGRESPATQASFRVSTE